MDQHKPTAGKEVGVARQKTRGGQDDVSMEVGTDRSWPHGRQLRLAMGEHQYGAGQGVPSMAMRFQECAGQIVNSPAVAHNLTRIVVYE